MAIPDLEDYLRDQISNRLNSLLGNPYIITESILKDFPKSVRKSFTETYTYDNSDKNSKPKAEIPVEFTYSQEKSNLAMILIQYKGGSEILESNGNTLGLHVGNADDAFGGYRKEDNLVVKKQDITANDGTVSTQMVVNTAYPIYGVESISNVSGLDYTVSDNMIIYPNIEFLEGTLVDVTYVAHSVDDSTGTLTKERVGQGFGYEVLESLTIDVLSTNIDTLRCLTTIMRVIMITMKLDVQEQRDYRLSSLDFHGVDILQAIGDANTTALGNQMFYRRIEVGYQVTYSMNIRIGEVIDSFKIGLNIDGEEIWENDSDK